MCDIWKNVRKAAVSDLGIFGRDFNVFIPEETVQQYSIDDRSCLIIETIETNSFLIEDKVMHRVLVHDNAVNPEIKFAIYIAKEDIHNCEIIEGDEFAVDYLE